jgi:molecular chaperone GrpE
MPSSPVSDEGSPAVEERRAEEGQATPDQAAELAAMEDRYKRALADLDNYRKRSEREVERRVTESREAQLRQWLEVVDSVDRALQLTPDGPAAEGLRAVLEQMEAILARQGVERVGAVGESFDPERHDAVAVVPSAEVPDRTVLEVARSGFSLGDRVLRPAQVVVARHEGP